MVVPARRLRVLFFGTPAFAVPTLEALLQSPHEIVGVVTQPDRPRGRGQKISDAPVKHFAAAASLPILQPSRLKDDAFLSEVRALDVDLGVVAAYGKILPEELLRLPRLGMINVHASLLPRYRGASPVHRAIIDGETYTGVTIMRVVKALDAGAMLSTVRRPIGSAETSVEVERDLAHLGASLLVSTMERLADGTAVEEAQDESASTYAPRLTKADGLIDWSRTSAEIHNLVRGLHPWPHAFTFLNGERVIFLRSEPLGDDAGAPPGTIVHAAADDLRVATGAGTLRVVQLQAEGKRPMSVRDFLSGHRMTPGERFGSS